MRHMSNIIVNLFDVLSVCCNYVREMCLFLQQTL